jgi:hypothetical protein
MQMETFGSLKTRGAGTAANTLGRFRRSASSESERRLKNPCFPPPIQTKYPATYLRPTPAIRMARPGFISEADTYF